MNPTSKLRRPDARRAAGWRVPVTIRLAEAGDADEIARVAGRDCRPAPPAPQLVAERKGAIEAVLSLRTGGVVADPFRHTAELVELLRCHAGGVRVAGGDGHRGRDEHRPAQRRRLDLGLAGAGGCR
jgi:hypothetical protein